MSLGKIFVLLGILLLVLALVFHLASIASGSLILLVILGSLVIAVGYLLT